jgi:hypothetical protein
LKVLLPIGLRNEFIIQGVGILFQNGNQAIQNLQRTGQRFARLKAGLAFGSPKQFLPG